jgi:nucleoside-diphosphate-sugar epimerase
VFHGEEVLVTGATGKIGFPIARALTPANDVWGAARLRTPHDHARLTTAGVTPIALDIATGDFSGLPDDFTYMFHAAVDPGTGSWGACLETNAQNFGELLYHCRSAKGFALCSTGSIYGYRGRQPLTESDPPGVPLRANYSVSKVAAEAVCTWISRRYAIPLTIIRICSTSGPECGAPADRLEAMLAGRPIRLHPDKPNNYHPIYEDDYVDFGIRAMEIAKTPPEVVNCAGSETVSVEEYCAFMGKLVGVTPTFEYTQDAHTPLRRPGAARYRDAGATDLATQIVALGNDPATRAAARRRTEEFLATLGSLQVQLAGTRSAATAGQDMTPHRNTSTRATGSASPRAASACALKARAAPLSSCSTESTVLSNSCGQVSPHRVTSVMP